MAVAGSRSVEDQPRARRAVAAVAGLLALALSAPAAPAQEPEPLRVGAIRYKSEEAFVATYEPLVDYLSASLGRRPELTLVDEERLAFELAAGKFDLGIFTPFPYLKARLDFPELEVFASHVVHRGETYRGAILVRADSDIESVADLRDHSIFFVKPTSTSGFKLPEGILHEHGLHLGVSADDHRFSGGHDASLRALLAGEVDAVAVDAEALSALAAEERSALRSIEEYQVPYHAYVLSPRLAPETGARLRDAMLTAHRDPDNRPLFANPLGIERWVAREDTFYNGLRRYLGMVRSKPQLALNLRLKESARRALEGQGDLLEVLEDTIENELERSGRFSPAAAGAAVAPLEAVLDLARVDDLYHCQIHLGDRWLRSIDLADGELLHRLPSELVGAVLAATPLTAPLLFNGADWFITFGSNDGIDPESYEFALTDPSGGLVALPPAEVLASTPLNTFFHANEAFRRGAPITMTYRTPDAIDSVASTLLGSEVDADALEHDHAEVTALERFWGNLDNRWGVIGLVVAILSLAFGGYLRLRKQRRFRTVLNESLDLLRLYLEGKYDLEARLLEQREKILHFLEKNFINENQYLILKHHLDEVEGVIGQLASQPVADTQEVQAELQQIVRDGKITADELEHLAATLRQVEGAQPPAAEAPPEIAEQVGGPDDLTN